MSLTGFALKALSNFQPTNSVLAGGGAALLIYGLGAALVAAGVAIPPLGFLGMTAALPITMGMVGAVSIPLGHLVSSFVPDSINQQINALAKKASDIVPQLQQQFPTGVNGATEPEVKAAAAINVIANHVENCDFPTGKNGQSGNV